MGAEVLQDKERMTAQLDKRKWLQISLQKLAHREGERESLFNSVALSLQPHDRSSNVED